MVELTNERAPSVGLSFGGVFDRSGVSGIDALGAGKGLVRKGLDYYCWGLGLGIGRQKELARGRLEMHLGYVQPGREFPMAGLFEE